ncbi:MAG TPA: Fic family protein [Cyclobacteriaceae bacterium]|nr:Fic family protein [Cyclobacteriaceae bacterium]
MPWLLKGRTELGELKGYSHVLPNPMLLMSSAIIRESVASSGIENINTTVENVLEQQLFPETEQKSENKEVLRYNNAMLWGFENMKKLPIGNRLILGIHKQLLGDRGHGYRRTQNKIENSGTGEVLYTPPPANGIGGLISNLEKYIHDDDGIDPLIKCAISHYQFEAIHPFGDGNGRAGRILMVLYLVQEGLLNYPILFISGFINENRNDYYRLLRDVTIKGNWCEFIEYLLRGIYLQARETKEQLFKVMDLFKEYKEGIKNKCGKIYSSDLVEVLFSMPIVTPVRLGAMLDVHYTTATRYLKQLEKEGFLRNEQAGKYQLYINQPLVRLLRNK